MSVVITGAGPIGSTIARQYAQAGTPVVVLTRSGSGPDHRLVDRRRVDVNDLVALRAAVEGAEVIHHCIHASAYTERAWARELPAAERAVLAVAAENDALVVFPESLYSFDTTGIVTESTGRTRHSGKPTVRAALLDARVASPARTASVIGSDYFGPGSGANAHAGDRMLKPAIDGGTVRPLGSADLPHSWTYLPDLAAAMIRAADLPERPDRLLFAPTAAPRTQRELATAYAVAAGRPAPKVTPLPWWLLRTMGVVHAGTRGLVEMGYLFDHPLVMDSSASEAELGLAPTPWAEAIAATVAEYRAR